MYVVPLRKTRRGGKGFGRSWVFARSRGAVAARWRLSSQNEVSFDCFVVIGSLTRRGKKTSRWPPSATSSDGAWSSYQQLPALLLATVERQQARIDRQRRGIDWLMREAHPR